MSVFCPNCNKELAEGAQFCDACGARIELQGAAQAPPPVQPPPQQYQPPPQQYQPPPQQPPPQQPPPPQYQQPQQPQQQYQQPPQQYQQPQQQYQQPQQGYAPPPGPEAPYDPARDAETNKLMAVLSYLIFFIPLLTGAHKTSPFVKFHVNQGTVLFFGYIAFGIISGILSAISVAIMFTSAYVLSVLLSILIALIWIVPAALAILGIINAVTGKMKPLPVIGKFTIIK